MTVRVGADDVSAARNAGDYAHLVCHGSRWRRRIRSSKRPRLSCVVRSYAAAAKDSGTTAILAAVAAVPRPMPATTAWLCMRFSWFSADYRIS